MKTGKGDIIMNTATASADEPVIMALIMGQPRSGKSTVAARFAKQHNLPVIHTDRLRADLRLHCPWCGYDTEIEPWNEDKFIEELLLLVAETGPCVVEGSSIAPRMLDRLSPMSCVMMVRNDTPEDMLISCRKYDNDTCWTYRKADTYLLKLFGNYQAYAAKWREECSDLCVETGQNFEDGVDEALRRLETAIADTDISLI